MLYIVLCFQWWIYPSDKKRPNEFGYQYEPESTAINPSAQSAAVNEGNKTDFGDISE